MPTSRSNEEWLRDLRSEGAPQMAALEALRGHLLGALPGVLGRHGGLPDAILEDVVQDSLLRALDRLDGFEGRSRFTTWVMTIAIRMAMTELRRLRWKDVSLEAITAGGELSLPDRGSSDSSPEEQLSQLRMLRALREVLESELSDRQRTAIVAELRGLPQEEIGRRLGISRNAVYKLGHDARKKLKRGLEAAGFDAAEIRSAFS